MNVLSYKYANRRLGFGKKLSSGSDLSLDWVRQIIHDGRFVEAVEGLERVLAWTPGDIKTQEVLERVRGQQEDLAEKA